MWLACGTVYVFQMFRIQSRHFGVEHGESDDHVGKSLHTYIYCFCLMELTGCILGSEKEGDGRTCADWLHFGAPMWLACGTGDVC